MTAEAAVKRQRAIEEQLDKDVDLALAESLGGTREQALRSVALRYIGAAYDLMHDYLEIT